MPADRAPPPTWHPSREDPRSLLGVLVRLFKPLQDLDEALGGGLDQRGVIAAQLLADLGLDFRTKGAGAARAPGRVSSVRVDVHHGGNCLAVLHFSPISSPRC